MYLPKNIIANIPSPIPIVLLIFYPFYIIRIKYYYDKNGRKKYYLNSITIISGGQLKRSGRMLTPIPFVVIPV